MDKNFDVYGWNALVDMEFEVSPGFLEEVGIKKGLMTLVMAKTEEILKSLNIEEAKGVVVGCCEHYYRCFSVWR